MVNVTTNPIIVEGVRLDTLAWGVEAATFTLGAPRPGDVVLPGVDGVVPSLSDPREASGLTLSMFVRGTDVDGVVPAGSGRVTQVRENLRTLLALFGKTWGLLDVREVVDSAAAGTTGTVRAWCKPLDSIAPDVEPGSVARLTVSLLIPSGRWQDVDTTDWTQANPGNGTTREVVTLRGSSLPVTDAVVLVAGPTTSAVTVVDNTTGEWVRLNRPLASGEAWRLNTATWTSRTGTGLTLASADTAGTDRAAETDTSGPTPHLLRLVPAVNPSTLLRTISVRALASGMTTATTLSIRARKAHAL